MLKKTEEERFLCHFLHRELTQKWQLWQFSGKKYDAVAKWLEITEMQR